MAKMVTSCCVVGCTNRFQKGGKIKLFRFPRGKRQRSAWVHAINRTDFIPKDHSRVCSIHFVSGCPDFDHRGNVDFAPSVFFHHKNTVTPADQTIHKETSGRNIATTFETAARLQEQYLTAQLKASVSFHKYCQSQDDSTETAKEVLVTHCNTDVSIGPSSNQSNESQNSVKKTGILTDKNINLDRRRRIEEKDSAKDDFKPKHQK